jgi:hypothetical protein
MTQTAVYNATTGRFDPQDTSDASELGYASRTTNDTTTNAAYASSSSNKISGLSVTVVGEGLPVLIEFYCPSVAHSVANSAVNATLVINGALSGGQIGTSHSISSTVGQGMLLRHRKVLALGTSYTFEIGKYLGAAGTGTYTGNADFPMHLAVTR